MMFLDLETSSLHADIGIIIAVGFILPNGKKEIIFTEEPEREKETIEKALEVIKKNKNEILIIWHSGFDIPFLLTRAIKHNVDASVLFEVKVIDLCKFARENLALASYRLDEVSRFLGIRKNLSITGKNVQELYFHFLRRNEKAKKEIIEHCEDDLEALQDLYKKLEIYVKKFLESSVKNFSLKN
ncbi:MAG: ribonuclease H-like domain-containing protein [Candidatus Aenigmarchaeota archaeon]|nr:ribonuclease H-like domain-containing protein [Candidatus Aenigmarchaeota archaeon]